MVGLLTLFVGGAVHASVTTLTNGNSSAAFDFGANPGSGLYNTGLLHWTVDGQDQMEQEWFWYRVGASGPEANLSTLGAPIVFDPSPFVTGDVGVYYGSDPRFDLAATFKLNGGAAGSGYSQLLETVTVVNKTQSALEFHLFEFTDFDIHGAGNDIGKITTSTDPVTGAFRVNSMDQYDNAFNLDRGFVGLSDPAQHYLFGQDATVSAGLTDGSPTTLGDTASNIASPGTDLALAVQWDLGLTAGQTKSISKFKEFYLAPVPEAGSMILFGLGMLGLGLVRRVRKA